MPSILDDPELLRELGDDIDLRMLDVQRQAMEALPDADWDKVAVLLRLAYGRGYMDAVGEEAEGTPHELLARHGLAKPEKRRRRSSARR